MQGQVPEKIKKEHSNRMLELAGESSRRFREKFIGRTGQVLWENRVSKGSRIYSGLTDNYLRVFASNSSDLTNTITPVCLVRLYEGGLWGEVAK
jgi:threonylcarbamoyladenosine tRNA methylthiotransferase MtaB